MSWRFVSFQINELKAENYEAEKDARVKVTTLQKQHEDTVSSLQVSDIYSNELDNDKTTGLYSIHTSWQVQGTQTLYFSTS